MNQTNAITPPNTFLKCYKTRTVAIKAGDYFSLDQSRINQVYHPFDTAFTGPYNFYATDYLATINGIDPRDNGECVIWSTTKKAVFTFQKHPAAAPFDYLANYSFGRDMYLPTFIGAVPDPYNSMAKEGDSIEIYGLNEIAKFFAGPLHHTFPQEPFLLTIALFE